MKKSNLFLFTLVSIFLFSCSETTLDEKKSELKEVESEIETLKEKAISLKEEIYELDPKAKPEKAELITTIKVESKPFSKYIEAQGTTYSDKNVNVTSDIGGIAERINVSVGQFIQKGTTLISLDNQLLKKQLEEIKTKLQLAKNVYEKRKRLWDQNIGSEIEYLQAKNNYESLLDSENTLNTQISKSSVKAPISGYVDEIYVKLGEMVSPGAPAVQLVNLSEMEVRADLPEIYLKAVNKGAEIKVEIPVLDLEENAKITSIGNTINPANRTFRVIAKIDNKEGKVKPNLLSKIKIEEVSYENAVTIPARLLQESSNGYFVFIAKKDEEGNYRAQRTIVEIGVAYNGEIVILEGIKPQDLLVDMGYRSVLENQLLEIKEDTELQTNSKE